MILNKFEGAMLFLVLKIANPNGDSNLTENLKVQKIKSRINYSVFLWNTTIRCSIKIWFRSGKGEVFLKSAIL